MSTVLNQGTLGSKDDYLGKKLSAQFVADILNLDRASTPCATNIDEFLILDPRETDPVHLAGKTEATALIKEALLSLSYRSRTVLEYRFGMGRPQSTLEEVGKIFNVTSATIREVEVKALQNLMKVTGALRAATALGLEVSP